MSPLPRPFGRYVLQERIGEGGMAEVYLATATVGERLHKQVVIKTIRPEYAAHESFVRMFVDEAKIALSLTHAGIVQTFDFGVADGLHFLAMERVDGLDLMRLFRSMGRIGERFDPVVVATIGHRVAAALAYAHRKTDEHGRPLHIVHRDVSPHNVMVSVEGQVKILDFGIARIDPHAHETTAVDVRGEADDRTDATIKGKLAYMSPEQACGQDVDGRADLYSLGVVMHELLTGRLLFRDEDRSRALSMVRSRQVPPLLEHAPHVPPALAAIVERAMQLDVAARYPSARAMQAALGGFLHGSETLVDDEALAELVRRHLPRKPAHRSPTEPAAAALRIVVHVAFAGSGRTRPGPLRDLVEEHAGQRGAQVVRSDDAGVTLAFGELDSTPDFSAALRTAVALREDTTRGSATRAGILVVPVSIDPHHGPLGSELAERLDAAARHWVDADVMVAEEIARRAARQFRFGSPVRSDDKGRPWVLLPLHGPAFVTSRPERSTALGRPLLLGRDRELGTLRGVFSEAIRAKRSAAVLIEGAPGMGKHAVVDRFIGSLPRTACWIMRAPRHPEHRNEVLGTLLDVVVRFLDLPREVDQATLRAQLQAHGMPDAAGAAKVLGSALGHAAWDEQLDPFTRRDRLWSLCTGLIAALCQRRPVLLVIEDAHLRDEQSLTLLREWLSHRQSLPVLVVLTGRSESPRLVAWRADPRVEVIALAELDSATRRELLARRFDDPEHAEPLLGAILEQTGGNPLFIEQMLAALLERGVVAADPSRRGLVVLKPHASIELPPSVEATLTERIEELAPGPRQALQAAAVLGLQVRVGEVSGLLERDAEPDLDLLVARGFLEPALGLRASSPKTLRFSTTSLQEVAKGTVPRARSRALHAKAAALLAGRSDYSPERDDGAIADHWIAADEPTRAVPYALAAAMRAFDLAGNVEAYYHLSQALSALPSDDPRRFDALLRRERILRAWGRRRAQGADVRALLETAERSGERDKQVVAAIRLLRFYLEVGRLGQADRLLPRIQAALEDLPHPAPFAAVLGELRSELAFARGDLETAESIARAALRHCGDDQRGRRQRCRLLRAIGQVEAARGHFEAASALHQEAVEIAKEIGNARLEANLLNALGEVAGRSGRFQLAIEHFRAALDIDRALGDRFATGRKLANLGTTFACVGLLGRAERYLRKALELHEAVGHPGEFGDVVVQLGEVVASSGDLQAARAIFSDAARVARERGDLRTELRARVLSAEAMAQTEAEIDLGIRNDARDEALDVLERARAHGLRTAQCRALHTLAILAAREGDLPRALEVGEQARALVRSGAAPLDAVQVLHHLALCYAAAGRADAAAEQREEAAAIVRARLQALSDPALRQAYRSRPEVRDLVEDAQS